MYRVRHRLRQRINAGTKLIKLMANKDKVRQALQWLDEDIREALDIVIFKKADEILCNLIKDLRFKEIVEIYNSIDK